MPIISGEGGGGTFNGGTITGRLKVADPVASHIGVEIDAPVGSIAAHKEQLLILDENGDELLGVQGDGTHVVGITNDASANWTVQTLTGGRTLLQVFSDHIGVGGPMKFGSASPPVLLNVVAPADGDLNPSECALWFDDTNGVGNTKLMVKGKSADGTVKTAAIVLA